MSLPHFWSLRWSAREACKGRRSLHVIAFPGFDYGGTRGISHWWSIPLPLSLVLRGMLSAPVPHLQCPLALCRAKVQPVLVPVLCTMVSKDVEAPGRWSYSAPVRLKLYSNISGEHLKPDVHPSPGPWWDGKIAQAWVQRLGRGARRGLAWNHRISHFTDNCCTW